MDKKLCLLVGLFLLVTKVFAITVHWDGEGGDGLWTTAINWSSNLVPNEDDDIVIDNSIVTSSYTIRLPDIAVTVRSLSMLPDAAFSITLLLPSTNTITSAAFATTGSGYTIVIGSGATFINNGLVSSGTNLVIGDSMQVRNGGRYVHRTRSGHSTWLSRLSKMPITANGTIEFDVPVSSYVISLSGRSYGNLVLSSQLHGVPVTYSGNGSQNVFIRGRLELTAATTLTLSFSGGEFLVENDLVIAPNSTFNVQASSNSNIVRLKGNINVAGTITETGTGNPQLILSGSSQQSVRIQSLQGSVVLDVNNSNGISLSAPLLISHILRLSSGKVKTTGTELLTIADNAVIEGASFEKFVDGPLGKIGDEAFLFPVGKGLQFASASLSAGTDVADEYICEYHQGNPMVIFGDSFETPGLTHMSSLEWWTIERRSGNTARQVSLLVTTYSDATLLEHLRVLRFDGQEWKNEGNISYSGLSFGT
ncbi:MAG TPA: hypothetical protein VEB42_05680, partial [Chitinophagaceae bacterium]|nr:hypothetical protein [Chitinophagaceae bacterium]